MAKSRTTKVAPMHIKLAPLLEEFVTSMVATGKFKSVDAVVEDAVQRMMTRERYMREIDDLIQEGLDSAADEGWIDGESAFAQVLSRSKPVKRTTARRSA